MSQQLSTTTGQDVTRVDGAESIRARRVFAPATDIYETEDDVVVIAEMPGVSAESVEITLERGVLTLRGAAASAPREGVRRVYSEYAEGDYERVFSLSETIDQSAIQARHENGVLTVRLPKAEPAKPRKIEVRRA